MTLLLITSVCTESLNMLPEDCDMTQRPEDDIKERNFSYCLQWMYNAVLHSSVWYGTQNCFDGASHQLGRNCKQDREAADSTGASCSFAKDSSLSRMWLALAKGRPGPKERPDAHRWTEYNSWGNTTRYEIVTLLNRCKRGSQMHQFYTKTNLIKNCNILYLNKTQRKSVHNLHKCIQNVAHMPTINHNKGIAAINILPCI